MRKTAAAVLAMALLAGACNDDSGDSTTSTSATTRGSTAVTSDGGATAVADRFDPGDIQFVTALERLDSCDAVLAHFQAEALARVTAYGLEGGGGWWPPGPVFAEESGRAMVDDAATEAPATTVAATQAGDGSDGGGFSGTNVQVAGVDEPDIIKTDGERIVTINNGVLTYVDATGDDPEVLGTLRFEEGWGHTLFMSGDRAFVFVQGDQWLAVPEPLPADDAASVLPPPYTGPTTVIFEVDLEDPAEMRIVRTMRIDGQYLSARMIDDTVRVVVSAYPNDLPFVYPSSPAAEEIALAANRTAIEQSVVNDWLPDFTLYAGGEVASTGLAVACDRVHRPAEFAGFETLAVLTFDIGDGLSSGVGTGVIADGETVYASTESLYVATNVWVPEAWLGDEDLDDFEESYSTAIHQFDISGTGPAEYLASGSVDGHLLNQFSMDEYEGRLRVATTDGPPWWFEDDSQSGVSVMERSGDRLVEVGRVGGLGEGERIFAVRFIGETGYVVTFRQTDPLFVIDLRDPEAPAVTGELEIPGYSAYLHPIGEGLLLGVGQDATEEGWTTGAKVSLFDVSDPTDPRQLDTWVLEDGYTEAEWDHHAFLYWAPLDLAVLPMQSWASDFHGAVVLGTDDGLRERGRITHDLGEERPTSDCRIVELPAEVRDFEGGAVFQICAEDDIGGYGSYFCESIPIEESEWITEEFGVDLGDTEDGDRIELCWPDYGNEVPIQRSLVVGDLLWTLSWRALQANDLGTLDVLHQLPIG